MQHTVSTPALTVRSRRLPMLFATTALSLGIASLAGAAELYRPDPAGLSEYWDVNGLSGNGRVFVGSYDNAVGYDTAYMWTDDFGYVTLAQLPGGDEFAESYAFGVNRDGSVIVGKSNDVPDNYREYAVKWSASGIHRLPLLNNGNGAFAAAVSSDGTIVVGGAKDGSDANHMKPVRWTGDTIGSLGTIQNSTYSYATGVSGDGSVISGMFDLGNNAFGGFVWQQGTGLVDMGYLNGGLRTWTRAVSRDGSTIVGGASDGLTDLDTPITYHVQSQTLTALPLIQGSSSGSAYGVDADGGVVVGIADLPGFDNHVGFRWTASGGMQTVDDWMRDNGVTLAQDITKSAYGVSDDGTVVVGETRDDLPYIARLARPITLPPEPPPPTPTPTPTPGIIVISKYMNTIAHKSGSAVAVKGMDVVMHGAHGSPMQVMPEAGKSTAWATGDLGYHDGNGTSGRLGAGEIGVAHGFDGGLVGRFAFGRTFDRADLDLGGTASQDGSYILPEATFDLGGIKTTLSAYANWSHLSVNRGYENGSAMDYSKGEADSTTYAGRIRFDWLNAFSLAGTEVTPYASYTTALSRLDAYTEKGGSFPASFDRQTEHFNAVRAGLDFTHALTEDVTLLGRVEGAYRFEKEGPTVSGGIVGLNDFTVAGNAYRQTWGRVGAGIEFKAGAGTGSLMVNATTDGSDPKVWLASSWRVSF